MGKCGLPNRPAVFGIDGDEVSVNGAHEQRIPEDSQSAIDASTAWTRPARRTVRERPKDSSRGGVQSDYVIRRLNGVHDAIHHQRRSFKLLQRPGLKNPPQLQVLYVR